MVGYYRSFIPQFLEFAAPLTDCLREKAKRIWDWMPTCQDAFDKLKRVLCEAPVLRIPDFTRPFRVTTDTSGRGVGVVLSQDFDGEDHPILYLSQKLNPTEVKYSTIEIFSSKVGAGCFTLLPGGSPLRANDGSCFLNLAQ